MLTHLQCDEKYPSCTACIRHGLPCSLAESFESGGHGPGGSPSDSISSPSVHSAIREDNPFPYLSNLVRSQEESTQDFRTWTTDLELMHQYTAITWRTLPRPDEMAEIWQIKLPQLALTHDYLMHQLLAISAAHLAHLNSSGSDDGNGDQEQRRATYSIRATQHQNRALQRLQNALPDISDTNCPAIFLTASLLSIGAFTSLSATQSIKPGIDELMHVFFLIRGMHGILTSYNDVLKTTFLGQLLQPGQSQVHSPLLTDIMDELTTLRMLPTSSVHGSDGGKEALREAIDEFMYWIRHATGTADYPELRVVMTWPTRLKDGFTNLVRQRDGDALRVLTCFCRLLEVSGPSHWFLEGWGECVLADINR